MGRASARKRPGVGRNMHFRNQKVGVARVQATKGRTGNVAGSSLGIQ